MTAVDDSFIDKFLEIRFGADEIALVADIFAPGIFDFPAVRLAVPVKMDTCEQHGVGRRTTVIFQALAFGHIRGKTAQKGFVLDAGRVPDTFLTGAEGPGIAGEPNGLAVFQLLDAEVFQGCLRQVQRLHVTAGHVFNGMELDGRIQRLIRRRFIDDGDVIAQR